MAMQTWNVDPSHSSVSFSVRHLVISKVRGRFERFTAKFALDPENPATSSVEAQIEAASIQTNDEKRDEHLRSADFLDVEKNPHIAFKSTAVEKTGADKYKVTGDLSIHGVTHPVTLDVEGLGQAKDPWGNLRAGYVARGHIDRKTFGLNWNVALEAGGVLVGDKVEIELDVQAIVGR